MQTNMRPLASPPHRFDGPGRADYGNNISTTAPDIEAAEPAQTRAGNDNAMRNATSGNEEGCLSKVGDALKKVGSCLKPDCSSATMRCIYMIQALVGAGTGAVFGVIASANSEDRNYGRGAAIGAVIGVPAYMLAQKAISHFFCDPCVDEIVDAERIRRDLYRDRDIFR